jgi:hypothetical protein
MHNEKIHEAWWDYLKGIFEFSFDDVPYLFRDPHCGTCSHWFLINEDGLHNLAVTSSPNEYDEIIKDLSGKRIYTYREKSEIKDTYRDYRFYGWCKRFPPVQRSGYSILGFRSLFTFMSRNIPKKVAEYDFPLMPHDSSCGEWKENSWVAIFINENNKKAQP